MKERLLLFLMSVFFCVSATAANRPVPDKFINRTLHGNIYPSTLNDSANGTNTIVQAGTESRAATATNGRRVVNRPTSARTTAKSGNTIQKTSPAPAPRRVVPRTNMARSGIKSPAMVRNSNTNRSQKRAVVARSGATAGNKRSATVVRGASGTTQTVVSSQQCFASYKECMDMYCERSNTAYNRCYCSARLAQIDSKYQNKIDSLIQQIIKLKYNTDATDAEIKQYWDETVGIYTNTNPWVNIDNALNLDWADMESRVRGQNAFNTGHTYCVNYLRSCAYMASNMRDAYRSEINRNCTSYEKTLERIQNAAESVIESYNQ